jgi:hypothetical protein
MLFSDEVVKRKISKVGCELLLAVWKLSTKVG